MGGKLTPMTDPSSALDAIGQLPDSEIDVADAALQLARVDAKRCVVEHHDLAPATGAALADVPQLQQAHWLGARSPASPPARPLASALSSERA